MLCHYAIRNWRLNYQTGMPGSSSGIAGALMQSTSEFFYVCSDHTIIAFKRSDGREVWRRKLGSFWTGPITMALSDHDAVYVVSASKRISCLNAISGDVIWEKKISEVGNGLRLLVLPGVDATQQQLAATDEPANTSGGSTSAAAGLSRAG
jgi:outer membrane protein assembly factor BamB